MRPDEWEWEALAATAFEAHASARHDEARHLWDRAGDLAAGFSDADPRRAASDSNIGLARLVQGQPAEARAACQEALRRWELALTWIDTMALAVAARSSLFHMRMERRHDASYQAFRRSRYAELAQGGKAVSAFNLALALLQLDEDAAADALLAEAVTLRRRTMGGRDPALAVMLGVLAGRREATGQRDEADLIAAEARGIVHEPARAGLELWAAERPHELNDERRLIAAAYLTATPQARDIG